MFDRPKPTVGCSANGRKRRRSHHKYAVPGTDTQPRRHSISAFVKPITKFHKNPFSASRNANKRAEVGGYKSTESSCYRGQ